MLLRPILPSYGLHVGGNYEYPEESYTRNKTGIETTLVEYDTYDGFVSMYSQKKLYILVKISFGAHYIN